MNSNELILNAGCFMSFVPLIINALVPILVVGAIIFVVVSWFIRLIKNGFNGKKAELITLILCTATGILAILFNMGWLRVILFVGIVVHGVVFFNTAFSASRYTDKSGTLKLNYYFCCITYALTYMFFPDAGDIGGKYFFFGLIRDERFVDFASFIAFTSFVANVVLIIPLLTETIRRKITLKKTGWKNMTQTYLFDFDGTLVDSMPTFAAVMIRILDENGILYPDDIVKIITPLGYKGTAAYFRRLGIDMPEDEMVALMNSYAEDEYKYRIQAKKNVVEALQKLKQRGASLNVLTASPHTMLDPCLERLGIYDLFDNVWSCDDFNTTKADPEIYKMAAGRIGKPVEEVLFLDDNLGADKTAKAAGMKVCGVYDDSSAEYEEDIKAITDMYIHDFSELI